ncbi:ubiquitin 3 binding protein But2 C-terminal domain-containing protein [Hypoxylon sp. FL1150]|nr:ubiquitin 3 binding protein But2 C-terminal domain-containing protein [Hypoxylon sp. FL1150]
MLPSAQPPKKVQRRALSRPDTQQRSGACPGELSGQWESPQLIVPVHSAHPNTAYGRSTFGEASSTISTVFSFNIPAEDDGKTCTLVFLFPDRHEDVAASSNMTGSGEIEFSRLDGAMGKKTTQNTVSDIVHSYKKVTVARSNAYKIESFACTGGQDVAVELSSVPGSKTELRFLQDSNSDACALGLYILKSSTGDVEL